MNGLSVEQFRLGLCIPSGSGMPRTDKERVASKIEDAFQSGIEE